MGKEIALQLAREGNTVYGAARRVEKMDDLVRAGGRALPLDVTIEARVKETVARVVQEAGRIDVLVNNAGFGLYGSVEDTSIDDARRQFEVNVFGVASMTKAVLPSMRARRSGRIINITSMGGKIYSPLGAWYHATKHALEGWSDCLRIELRQFGIDVVVVEPGVIDTEFGSVLETPMLARSGSGPYGAMARSVALATRMAYKPGAASPPAVVAKCVSKAIAVAHPKTRYSVGKFAKMMLFIRRWFSDRAFDTIIMGQVRNNKWPSG
jgi:short-subunit dehydrogenase